MTKYVDGAHKAGAAADSPVVADYQQSQDHPIDGSQNVESHGILCGLRGTAEARWTRKTPIKTAPIPKMRMETKMT